MIRLKSEYESEGKYKNILFYKMDTLNFILEQIGHMQEEINIIDQQVEKLMKEIEEQKKKDGFI